MSIIEQARDALDKATPIPYAPGYFVTANGEVISQGHNWRGYGARFIEPTTGKSGYLKVRLQLTGSG